MYRQLDLFGNFMFAPRRVVKMGLQFLLSYFCVYCRLWSIEEKAYQCNDFVIFASDCMLHYSLLNLTLYINFFLKLICYVIYKKKNMYYQCN